MFLFRSKFAKLLLYFSEKSVTIKIGSTYANTAFSLQTQKEEISFGTDNYERISQSGHV